MSELTRQHLELVTWKNDRWPRPQIQQDNILKKKEDIITNKFRMNAFWEKQSKNWDVQFEEIILRSFEWFPCVATHILEEEKWSCRFLGLMGHLLFCFFKNNLVDKIKACAVKASITKMNKISRCEDMSSQRILAIQPARSGIPGKKYKFTTFTCQLRFFVGVSSNKNRW